MADNIYLLFRQATTASGAAHLLASYTTKQAATNDVVERNRLDPATSGRFFVARFEAQLETLLAVSGQLQLQIDQIEASGIAYDDTALSGFLQGQINQNKTDIVLASGDLHAVDIQSSGYLQFQIDQDKQNLLIASGLLYDTTIKASGLLQDQVDENTAYIAAASGSLQGQVDLARYQLSLSFGGGTTPGFTSSSSEYELAGTFPYPGSDNIVNPPTQLICYASMNQANKDGAIRVYDVTNDMTVGEANFTGNTAIEQQTVPLSNLPASGATMELHIKRTTSGGAITLYSATIF